MKYTKSTHLVGAFIMQESRCKMEHTTPKQKNLILILIILVSILLGVLIGFQLRTNQISINNSNTAINGNIGVYKVNINKATKEELESLEGIGEIKAQKVIDHRPYTSVYQLKEFIGDTVFNKIKDNLEV